jgi:hypothetical protein
MNIAEKQWKEGCCVPACQECATDLRGFWRLCGNRRSKHYREAAEILALTNASQLDASDMQLN